MTFKLSTSLLGLALLLTAISCKRSKSGLNDTLPFGDADTSQVDIVLAGLTLDEKIGQLILWDVPLEDSISRRELFEKNEAGLVGGVMLKNLHLTTFLYGTDSLKRSAKLPLFIGSEEKVSLRNQFSQLKKFPRPATLAAIDSIALDSMLELRYVNDCKALGINFTFAPTLKTDVAASQTFDYQTFEEEKAKLDHRFDRNFKLLKNNRILAVADDFPKLEFIQNDSLRRVELHRYLTKVNEGLGGLLMADRLFDEDTLKKLPANYPKFYLERYMRYKGLMVVKINDDESPERKLLAGADMLVTSDAGKLFRTAQRLIENGDLTEMELNQRVRRVLLAKSWVNGGSLPIKLSIIPHDSLTNKPVKFVSISEKRQPNVVHTHRPKSPKLDSKVDKTVCYFEDPRWSFFIEKMYENSVVLARDEQGILPFQKIYDTDYQVFKFTKRNFRNFEYMFAKYANFKSIEKPQTASGELASVELGKTARIPMAVILLDSIDLQPGFHKQFLESINLLAVQSQVVVINFGNPKNLQYFSNPVACVQIFEKNKSTESYAAQLLFGGVSAEGKLPLSIGENLAFGASNPRKPVRLSFGEAENTGIASEKLVGINAIAESAIDNGVFPGCQVAVAKDGEVIFSKSFGHFTYSKTAQPVQNTDLYDIASLTKVSATTLVAMKLVNEKQLELDSTIADYISVPVGSPIGNIKIRQLLLHQSGLQAQMPLSRFFNGKNVPAKGCNDYFCRKRKGGYSVKVADGLFFRQTFQDTILKRVFNLPVMSTPKFRYSDVNFYLLKLVLEKITQMPLDKYVFENIYRPLGLRNITFNPLEKLSRNRLIPTEQDNYWRKTLVQGYVHDPCVALLGGVGGSAGIFTNAEDLAVLFQMLLEDGQYGGLRIYDENTVENFIAVQNATNHRGLGFDKPTKRKYPTYSSNASPKTFGHTGFTGTCAWVDPEQKLVYVFLSNRVNPSSRNGKIFTENIRSRIHQVVYDAFGTFDSSLPVLETEEEVELEEGAGG